jgi:hypothetical protein
MYVLYNADCHGFLVTGNLDCEIDYVPLLRETQVKFVFEPFPIHTPKIVDGRDLYVHNTFTTHPQR